MSGEAKRQPPAAELLAIGATVRRHRLAKDWIPEKLAQESGLTRITVINVERGERDLRVGTLIDLARALGLRVADLLEEAGVDPPKDSDADPGD